MKDAEFIELLNLYVDHEISAADAARLEAEVQANPERRRAYQQYCRMQKGCKLLTRDFETVPAEPKVVAFDPARQRTSRPRHVAVMGALAAAACLAVIFVNRSGELPATVGTAPVAQLETRPATAEPAPARTGGIVHAVSLPPTRPATVTNPLLLSSRAQADALLAAAAEQAGGEFEWMRTVRFAPIQPRITLEKLFETPSVPGNGQRTYSSPQTAEGQIESVGFQFSK